MKNDEVVLRVCLKFPPWEVLQMSTEADLKLSPISPSRRRIFN